MNPIKKSLSVAALSVATFALVACGGKPQAPQQQSLVHTTAVTVNSETIPITYEYSGRITAYKETEVRARVSGILLHRNFVEGSEVKQGEVLFEIDPDTYQAQVMSARASVAQGEATYAQSVRDANRAEKLVIEKVQSTAMRDQAFAKRDVDAAALQQARAQLRIAELNLQYTKVTAPIGGLTSREAVPEGSLISNTGLLTTITQLDPIYVSFSYDDKDSTELRNLREAMAKRGESLSPLSVSVQFGDGTTYGEQGAVDFTSPTIDPQTGTLAVRAVLNNKERHLVPGQFVRVTVHGVDMANAIVIPEQALLQNNSGKYVFVAKEIPVPVKPGEETQNAGGAPKMMMVAEMRTVEISRQLPDRRWLLLPAAEKKEMVDLTEAEIAAETTRRNEAAKAGTPITDPMPTKKQVVRVSGIKPGEEVLTEGQYRLMQAPPGVKVPIIIMELDGKQTPAALKLQSQQAANAEQGK